MRADAGIGAHQVDQVGGQGRDTAGAGHFGRSAGGTGRDPAGRAPSGWRRPRALPAGVPVARPGARKVFGRMALHPPVRAAAAGGISGRPARPPSPDSRRRVRSAGFWPAPRSADIVRPMPGSRGAPDPPSASAPASEAGPAGPSQPSMSMISASAASRSETEIRSGSRGSMPAILPFPAVPATLPRSGQGHCRRGAGVRPGRPRPAGWRRRSWGTCPA